AHRRQRLAVGGEGRDGAGAREGAGRLARGHVPDVGDGPVRGRQRLAVRGERQRVYVVAVPGEGGALPARGRVPEAHAVGPAAGGGERFAVGRERQGVHLPLVAHTGRGLPPGGGVVHADGGRAPAGAPARRGQRLAVGREREGKDVLARAERAQLLAGLQVPQLDRGVPAARREGLAVGRDGDRVDEVWVAPEGADRLAGGGVPEP